jgi:hypothetical protein
LVFLVRRETIWQPWCRLFPDFSQEVKIIIFFISLSDVAISFLSTNSTSCSSHINCLNSLQLPFRGLSSL